MPVTIVLELCYPNVTIMAESMLLHMLVNHLVNLNKTTALLTENCLPLWHWQIISSVFYCKSALTTLSHMAYWFQEFWRATSSLAKEIVRILLSHWTQAGSQEWECWFFVPVPRGEWGNRCCSSHFSIHIILIFTRRYTGFSIKRWHHCQSYAGQKTGW